ncbi:Protein of unknown function [Leuconostoc citreum]|nr:Protein of unknown function [Leuconostoc citreum LBAE C11]CDX64263.1 Protein of unknown function [Leuconostoc citreum]
MIIVVAVVNKTSKQ